MDPDYVGQYLQVSFWNAWLGDLDPVVSVYDDEGTLLGQTDDPTYRTGSNVWWYDAGVTFPLPDTGRIYMTVEDAGGGGGEGAGYFYPLIFSGPWYFNTDPWETQENDDIASAEPITLSESTSTAGYWYGIYAGALDSAEDVADAFTFSADDCDGFDGNYLNVYAETAMHGSLLDAEVVVYQGGAEIARATVDPAGLSSDDPAIWDLALTSDDDIVVVVTPETGSEDGDLARYYYAGVVVNTAPLH
jgi:hypothetical protein